MEDGLKQEIQELKEAIAIHEKAVEFKKQQIDIETRLTDVVLKGLEKISPDFKYQADPEYWELQREKGRLKLEQDVGNLELDISNLEKHIEMKKERLSNLEE